MNMFCYQCQEAANNRGCKVFGSCGKKITTSNLQDLLVHLLKGISILANEFQHTDENFLMPARFVVDSLFATMPNVNFDDTKLHKLIDQAIAIRNDLKAMEKTPIIATHDSIDWQPLDSSEYESKAESIGVLATQDEDVRSVQELLIYTLKGISAYAYHARNLGYEDTKIYEFIISTMSHATNDLKFSDITILISQAGKASLKAMALLDKAHTESYGHPEITEVNLGVHKGPGILLSGYDLKDMEQLLEQTADTGVDVYTHGEMIAAHYYPAFKKHKHLIGNYGSSWWKQAEELDSFNGPIVFNSNHISPIKEEYKKKVFTTGEAAYEEIPHIEAVNGKKDFTTVIERAKRCHHPMGMEIGTFIGGFAHNQLSMLMDKIVPAIRNGDIKKFIIIVGTDGRQCTREYFTEVAENLPTDTIILTAGCAKYRFNELPLGNIAGIPRILDAGQCNDIYSIITFLKKLRESFSIDDINDLPVAIIFSWYEQRSLASLMALLHLGIKNIRLGPSFPAFLSPKVKEMILEKYHLLPIKNPKDDICAIMT